MIRPGSQNARLLDVLRDGPATNAQIHALAGHMIVNSRVAELRAHGYVIECEHTGGSGADAFRYTLLAEPETHSGQERAHVSGSAGSVIREEPDGQLALEAA